MADEADLAQQITEIFTEQAIASAEAQTPKPVGICYNCKESIPVTSAYCDQDCEEDHQKRARLARLAY